MSKIRAIVFSKDRACQLHLLLESMARHATCFHVYVLYDYTTKDKQWEKAYEKLQRMNFSFPIVWTKQDSFAVQTKAIAGQNLHNNQCCGLFTDDSVFYRPMELDDTQLAKFFDKSGSKSLSLRCGCNTILQKYWPPLKYLDPLENHGEVAWFEGTNIITWNYNDYDYDTNYGRPISLDGNLHPRASLYEWMCGTQWKCPRSLDSISRELIGGKMSAFEHSVLINYAVNLAYGGYADNYGLYHPQSLEELNQRFLDGEVIDYDKLNFLDIISSHTETKFEFTQP